MIRQFALHLILATLIPLSAVAGSGSATFRFLTNDMSPRAAALGGSLVTLSDDPNVIFYNPSALSTLSRQKLSFGYLKHLVGINAGYASFGTEVMGLGYVGGGISYVNYGEFQRRGEEGQELGTFGAGEFSFAVGYGSVLESSLRYGASAKVIHSSIAGYQATGVALDAGILYEAVPQRLTVGASIVNLGTQLDSYMSTQEKLPLDVMVGASLYPEHLPAAILINFHKLNASASSALDRLKSFSVGVEFTPGDHLQLRVGYNNERRRDLKLGSSSGLAGFSVGGGIRTSMYNFDYAFNSFGKIGAMHRVGVGMNL